MTGELAADVGAALTAALAAAGVSRGATVAVSLAPGVGLGLATPDRSWAIPTVDPVSVVDALERALAPRWVWWSADTPAMLEVHGLRVARCWDVTAVHRLLSGRWRADPGVAWAFLQGLDPDTRPVMGQLDLLGTATGEGGDPADPVRPDSHLRPEWTTGGWAQTPDRLARWAATAMTAADLQREGLAAQRHPLVAEATARSESAAELLCTELWADGLPVDIAEATAIIAAVVGGRPADEHDAVRLRDARDELVLRHAPPGPGRDLRNPAHVRSMLVRLGIDVPDTRAHRLEPFRDAHPFVDALLAWRKAERMATTYGYEWLDDNVGADGRLRGRWSGSDGAAGRMTAQAGLHNLPAELRPAVVAEAGHVLVRSDLGQIEPRVLAAVSGDWALVEATAAEDMYAPVAARLGVGRSVAKVAVLAAMYGQTSGAAGQTLRAMESAYPTAMQFLRDADSAGQVGRDVRTHGGRLVRMGPLGADPAGSASAGDNRERRSAAAARGRYARNAVVQGAAAELFKAWAVTVRARSQPYGARIVLCLHDELLVHAPAEHGAAVAQVVTDALQEAAWRWMPGGTPNGHVRFVADTGVIRRWSEAKR